MGNATVSDIHVRVISAQHCVIQGWRKVFDSTDNTQNSKGVSCWTVVSQIYKPSGSRQTRIRIAINSQSKPSIQSIIFTLKHNFSTLISTLLVGSGTLVAAVPQPEAAPAQVHARDPSEIFQLDKRCQSNGQYCDGLAIRCCSGQCCTNHQGGLRFCESCG
ncbi:hypothetical protein BDW62DRAFT_205046 [Aspergillus aurantiobrunneus]